MIEKDPVGGALQRTVNRAFQPARGLIFEPPFETSAAHPFGTQLFA
jgi:hypothetical protein